MRFVKLAWHTSILLLTAAKVSAADTKAQSHRAWKKGYRGGVVGGGDVTKRVEGRVEIFCGCIYSLVISTLAHWRLAEGINQTTK